MIERILCDLDGVLADFHTGALSLFNRTWTDYPTHEAMLWKGINVTEAAFWKRIRETPGFWAGLPAFPWTRGIVETLDFLQTRGVGWEIVLNSKLGPEVLIQRRAWMDGNIRPGFSKYYACDKLTCVPRHQIGEALLVDDNPNVCKRFDELGGNSILFPSRLNGVTCGDPLDWFVRSLREKLTKPLPAVAESAGVAGPGDFETEQAVM